jgi:hypothetical protein
MTSRRIEGKVAKIVDESTVVINRGADSGVAEGMRFVIVAQGDEVMDPDTGRSLGTWEVVKGYLSATHVQPKLAVCAASQAAAEQEAAPRVAKTLSGAMVDVSFPKADADAKLNVQSGDMSGKPNVGPVKVGDTVRSVEGPA